MLAPASAFWLFSASAIYEFPAMREANAFAIIVQNPWTFLAASTMGLGINYLSYLVIQATSSLTMKVLGTVRNIFTILLGVMFYRYSVDVLIHYCQLFIKMLSYYFQ